MTRAEIHGRILDRLESLSVEQMQDFYWSMMAYFGSEQDQAESKEDITAGVFKENEKPSDFQGAWEGPVRSLEKIRVDAWQRENT